MKKLHDIVKSGEKVTDLNEAKVHDMDNIVDGVTYGDLRDAVMHNLPVEKINPKSVKKEYDEIMKTVNMDARSMLKSAIPQIIAELTK